MPGALALSHVNECSGEADSRGLHWKGEEGSDVSYLPGRPSPDSCQRVTTWGAGIERGLDRKVTIGRVAPI